MSTYFTQPYPARAAIGVAALPRGALVEVDAVLNLEREAGGMKRKAAQARQTGAPLNPWPPRPHASLAGYNKAAIAALAKLGIQREFDLVLHLPLRYDDETRLYPISEAPRGARRAGRRRSSSTTRSNTGPSASSCARVEDDIRRCWCCAFSISIRAR